MRIMPNTGWFETTCSFQWSVQEQIHQKAVLVASFEAFADPHP